MRVRIIFDLKNKGSHIPFHHQFLLAQVIKGILMNSGDEHYSNYNFYNFSGLKGQTKISRNGLHYYSSKVTLVLASMDPDFINFFLKQLFSFGVIEVGNLKIQPESVEQENVPEFSEEQKYICISPLVLREPKFNDTEGKNFISPELDKFSDFIYESTMTRMEKSELFDPEKLASFFRFQLVPDSNYLNKIRDTGKKFARIYPVYDRDVKYEVRGYTFPFTLFAAPEVHRFVFTSGLGAFAHKGFGMLDIANSDPVERSTPYNFQ